MIIGFWLAEILFCEYTENILNEWRREREALDMVLPSDLLALIEQGESHVVEFKKSTTDITKDVY